MAKKEDLLTAGKIAKKLGVAPGKVSKYIKEKKIKPDQKKGSCSYYGAATVRKIVKGLK